MSSVKYIQGMSPITVAVGSVLNKTSKDWCHSWPHVQHYGTCRSKQRPVNKRAKFRSKRRTMHTYPYSTYHIPIISALWKHLLSLLVTASNYKLCGKITHPCIFTCHWFWAGWVQSLDIQKEKPRCSTVSEDRCWHHKCSAWGGSKKKRKYAFASCDYSMQSSPRGVFNIKKLH